MEVRCVAGLNGQNLLNELYVQLQAKLYFSPEMQISENFVHDIYLSPNNISSEVIENKKFPKTISFPTGFRGENLLEINTNLKNKKYVQLNIRTDGKSYLNVAFDRTYWASVLPKNYGDSNPLSAKISNAGLMSQNYSYSDSNLVILGNLFQDGNFWYANETGLNRVYFHCPDSKFNDILKNSPIVAIQILDEGQEFTDLEITKFGGGKLPVDIGIGEGEEKTKIKL